MYQKWPNLIFPTVNSHMVTLVWGGGVSPRLTLEERGGGRSGTFLHQKWPDKIRPFVNSIAFGSAPRREADSQPISQLARPAVSQTETHSLGFLSVADVALSSGEEERLQNK